MRKSSTKKNSGTLFDGGKASKTKSNNGLSNSNTGISKSGGKSKSAGISKSNTENFISYTQAKSIPLSKKSYLPEGGLGKVKTETFKRYRYTKYWDFLFSCLGATVGFGNIWRFPALAAKHGGIYFLMVCLLIAVFIGIPMCCLEMFLGQLSGVGVAKTLRLMSPLFHGVGWAMICLTFVQSLQYGILLAYCIYYFFMTFRGVLWWTLCNRAWNTQACRPFGSFYTCMNLTGLQNDTDCATFNGSEPIPSTEEFYYNFILEAHPANKSHYGELSWQLSLALLLSYMIIFGCLMFGIRISSKVAYITVIFPYVGLLLIFIVCLTQDGSGEGLKSFFLPDDQETDKNQLEDMWTDAISHIIWSANIGSGIITAMTSYNPFHNNCKRDAVIIILLDIMTSFGASMCVFAGTGIIAKSMGKTNTNFLQKYGQYLAFIVYPEILSRIPGASFLSMLFFLILIVLGLDTAIWVAETCITEIADAYHPCRSGKRRIALVATFCFVSYLISLTFCQQGTGAFNLRSLVGTVNGYCIVLFAFLEAVAVFFIYGYKRFENDVSLIVGSVPNPLWKFSFLCSAPLMLFILLVIKVLDNSQLLFRNETLSYEYQAASVATSALITCIILILPAYQIGRKLIRRKPVITLLRPSQKWCPRKNADLEEQYKEIEQAERGIMGEFEVPTNKKTGSTSSEGTQKVGAKSPKMIKTSEGSTTSPKTEKLAKKK